MFDSNAYARQYYLKHKDRIIAQHQDYRDANRPRHRAIARKAKEKLRLSALKYYAQSDNPFCVRCGVKDIRVLCIDHTDNNGKEERKLAGCGSGSSFYRWLRTKGYPAGYQVLCWNCNHLKELERNQDAYSN